MHLLKRDFAAVRDLLAADGFTRDSGAGDVRYGIRRYLDAQG